MTNRISRNDPEIICEEKLEVNGVTVRLHKNLGPLSLTQFMSNAKTEEIKGLIVGRDIYYWDSFNPTHFQIAPALGVTYSNDDRLFFWRTENGNVLVDRNEATDVIEPPLLRLVKSPNIYFCASDGKWKTGMALAA